MFEIKDNIAIFTSGYKEGEYLKDAVIGIEKSRKIQSITVTKWQNTHVHIIAEEAIILLEPNVKIMHP